LVNVNAVAVAAQRLGDTCAGKDEPLLTYGDEVARMI